MVGRHMRFGPGPAW